jgi:hydrogenase maturation protease
LPEQAHTAVVGVGNILMGDEGVGVRVVQALEKGPLPEGVVLFDGGTAFQALMGELARFSKLVIVDAVDGGEPPGTIYRLGLDQILPGTGANGSSPERGPMRYLGPLSLHDLGVIEALMLERLAHHVSPTPRVSDETQIVVIGIQPARIEPSMELSAPLVRHLPALLQAVRDELGERPRQGARPSWHTLKEEEPL